MRYSSAARILPLRGTPERKDLMPGDYGTFEVMGAVFPLGPAHLSVEEKMYLLALGETTDPEQAAWYACLHPLSAREVRESLTERGLLTENGTPHFPALRALR